ncbi:hypothetical protein Hanom_Chr11g00986641 [Helianthus anomalus]
MFSLVRDEIITALIFYQQNRHHFHCEHKSDFKSRFEMSMFLFFTYNYNTVYVSEYEDTNKSVLECQSLTKNRFKNPKTIFVTSIKKPICYLCSYSSPKSNSGQGPIYDI